MALALSNPNRYLENYTTLRREVAPQRTRFSWRARERAALTNQYSPRPRLSLAALERFVHSDSNLEPTDLLAIPVELRDDIAIDAVEVETLPADSRTFPAPSALALIGEQWLRAFSTPVLSVPSVVIPHERILVEPDPSRIHSDRDWPFGAVPLRFQNVEEVMRYDRRTVIYCDRMREQRFLTVGDYYAGHRGEQTPRTLILGDRRIAVTAVLDAWLAPDHRYFKLRGADGSTYLVRHDEGSNPWELTMFRAEQVGG